MSLFEVAAVCYAFLLLLVIIWQTCLIVGAPWGHLTQGGRYIGVLPPVGRIVAAFSIPVMIFMAASVTSAADLYPYWAPWTALTAAALQTATTILNWITPSKPERFLWAPITTIMLLLLGSVVLSSYR